MTIEEKPKDNKKTIKVETSNTAGLLWVIGWMFTIAFAKLIWWQALLGLIIWPYYLGVVVR